jgi:hypothetical protein
MRERQHYLWKENLNSDGLYFRQYQHNEQSPFTLTHWTHTKHDDIWRWKSILYCFEVTIICQHNMTYVSFQSLSWHLLLTNTVPLDTRWPTSSFQSLSWHLLLTNTVPLDTRWPTSSFQSLSWHLLLTNTVPLVMFGETNGLNRKRKTEEQTKQWHDICLQYIILFVMFGDNLTSKNLHMTLYSQ